MPASTRTSSKPKETHVAFPLQLKSLRLHEVMARRVQPSKPLPRELALTVKLVSPEQPEGDSAHTIQVVFETEAPDAEGRTCRIHLSLEARFEKEPDSTPLSPSDIAEFEAKDAIVLLWPYLRQYLFDLTTKLELRVPPLPVIDPRALVASLAKSPVVTPRRSTRKKRHSDTERPLQA